MVDPSLDAYVPGTQLPQDAPDVLNFPTRHLVQGLPEILSSPAGQFVQDSSVLRY